MSRSSTAKAIEPLDTRTGAGPVRNESATLAILRPADVELFAGAGGLALGLAAAGIKGAHLFERNARACRTLTANKESGHASTIGHVNQIDVRDVEWKSFSHPVRLLAAGPPCQPFSLAGNHLGDSDHRNEFPATLRAVRELQPAVVLLENVSGLTRESFRPYLEYIVRQLAFPSIAPTSESEHWTEHNARIVAHAHRVGAEKQEYAVRWGVLNAADYGVPQQRTRLLIIATKRGYPPVEPPPPTHSRDALIHSQKSGEYWEKHGLVAPVDYTPPKSGPARTRDTEHRLKPWTTVREALTGLGEPRESEDDPLQHWYIPGARLYRGHSGSVMDWPSKTIKAGVHGVAGGENIIHLDDGTLRYFTLRELARIQGFPDDYLFDGPRSRVIGQIGNAVPCGLAEVIGRELMKMFGKFNQLTNRPTVARGARRGANNHVV